MSFDRSLFTNRLAQLCREHRITPAYRCVGLALLEYVGRDGTCWPAHITLAKRAGTSDRTVRRALAELRDVGLVSWQPRRARWNRRMSNLYALLSPAALTVKEKPIRVPMPRCPADRPRSVVAQLALLPVPTPEQIALVAARQAQLMGTARPGSPR